MEILDFLFSNIAFLVALIWFIASLFGKKQKEAQERNRHPRPVANPIDMELPWEKAEQEKEEPEYAEKQPSYQEEVVEPPAYVQESFSRAEEVRQTEELLSRVERIQRKRERRESTQDRERPGSERSSHSPAPGHVEKWIDLSHLERKEIVQGMVWSQVFGLPRAKSPHRTNPYYRSSFKR